MKKLLTVFLLLVTSLTFAQTTISLKKVQAWGVTGIGIVYNDNSNLYPTTPSPGGLYTLRTNAGNTGFEWYLDTAGSGGGGGTVSSVGMANSRGLTWTSSTANPITGSGIFTGKIDSSVWTSLYYSYKFRDSIAALITGATGVTSVGLTNAYGLTITTNTTNPITTTGTFTIKADTTKLATVYYTRKAVDSVASLIGSPTLYTNSVYSLKASTPGANYQVGSFSGNSIYGGGYFRWIVGNANAKVEILGYLVKSPSTTAGYWIRSDASSLTVEQLGADYTGQTLAAAGLSSTAAGYWGVAFAYMGRTLDVNTVTMDFVAVQMAMYMADLNQFGVIRGGNQNNCLIFNGNQGIRLPYHKTLANTVLKYDISTLNIAFYSVWKDWAFRDTNFTVGDDIYGVERVFHMHDIVINNCRSAYGGSSGAGACGLRINAGNNSLFEMIDVYNCDTGICIRHMETGMLLKCNAWNINKCGYFLGTATFAQGSSGQGQSNVTPIQACRAAMSGDAANSVGFYIQGCSDIDLSNSTVEGSGDGTGYAVVCDNYNTGFSHVPFFYITTLHIEISGGLSSGILVRAYGSNVKVENVYFQCDVVKGLIESTADGVTGIWFINSPLMGVSNIRCANKSGLTYWFFQNVKSGQFNPVDGLGWDWDNAACWYTGTGYTRVKFAKVFQGITDNTGRSAFADTIAVNVTTAGLADPVKINTNFASMCYMFSLLHQNWQLQSKKQNQNTERGWQTPFGMPY